VKNCEKLKRKALNFVKSNFGNLTWSILYDNIN